MRSVKHMLDTVRDRFQIKSDAALAERLGVRPSYICTARAKNQLGDRLALRIHERLGVPVKEIRDLASAPQE